MYANLTFEVYVLVLNLTWLYFRIKLVKLSLWYNRAFSSRYVKFEGHLALLTLSAKNLTQDIFVVPWGIYYKFVHLYRQSWHITVQ